MYAWVCLASIHSLVTPHKILGMSGTGSSAAVLRSKLHAVTTVWSGTYSPPHTLHVNLALGIWVEHYDCNGHVISVKMLILKRKNKN